MREHEVPTHVQAEDRVLLGLTFPQIVAVTAVCALAYGAYRYAPIGPWEIRMALAVLLGVLGIAMTVGKVGGRGLPLVAADLLRYRLGPRHYVGLLSQLVRPEAPMSVQSSRSNPNPLRLLARRATKTLRGLRRRKRNRRRREGRRPFRPHVWFGKRRRKNGEDRRGWLALVAAVVLAVGGAAPPVILADDRWKDEIDFEMIEPVPGQRLFIERLEVSEGWAEVTVRAATELSIRARAYGGPEGRSLRLTGRAALEEGESEDYSVPLHGPSPSFVVSWEDGLGQAGAITLKGAQFPHPLPSIERELCTVRLTSLGWTPGAVAGVIESECASSVKEQVELQMVAGHTDVSETALIEAQVTGVTGTVSSATGAARANAAFVPDGETRFRLQVPDGEAIHTVTVAMELSASLNVPIPPLTQLTHHPERTERRTETVSLHVPGTSETVSETVTVTHDDGTTTDHVVTAHASIPSSVYTEHISVAVVHPEHVRAEAVDRPPISRTRRETLALASAVASDASYQALVLPEPDSGASHAEQEPAGSDVMDWFRSLGWEWPW